jgi:hypothetical protein
VRRSPAPVPSVRSPTHSLLTHRGHHASNLRQGEGGRLWRPWKQYGQLSIILVYLGLMTNSDLLMDLPPLPPPALTDRHVFLTNIQLGTLALHRAACGPTPCAAEVVLHTALCVRAAPLCSPASPVETKRLRTM